MDELNDYIASTITYLLDLESINNIETVVTNKSGLIDYILKQCKYEIISFIKGKKVKEVIELSIPKYIFYLNNYDDLRQEITKNKCSILKTHICNHFNVNLLHYFVDDIIFDLTPSCIIQDINIKYNSGNKGSNSIFNIYDNFKDMIYIRLVEIFGRNNILNDIYYSGNIEIHLRKTKINV